MATIAAKAVSFLYPNATSPTTTVTVRPPQFDDKDTIDRRDVIQESAAGELIVYKRGPSRILIEWDLQFLPVTEKDELLNFFFFVVYGASNEFTLKVPNWSAKQVKLYSGATLAGSIVTSGGGYSSGQVVNPDYVYYTGVTFEESAIGFAQARDGWFNTPIRMRAKGKTL